MENKKGLRKGMLVMTRNTIPHQIAKLAQVKFVNTDNNARWVKIWHNKTQEKEHFDGFWVNIFDIYPASTRQKKAWK
jgi:hypothetical protein